MSNQDCVNRKQETESGLRKKIKKTAPSSDGEEAVIYFGSQAVITFWVLDPWLCVSGFHRICHSAGFAAVVQDNFLDPFGVRRVDRDLPVCIS